MPAAGPTLLVAADDRTGALEAGGACADLGFRTRFVRQPGPEDDCAVLDLASRHVPAAEARRRTMLAHRHRARHRCHKMDSVLRGNWPHEVAALLAGGRRVGVLASFPDAGRRCDGGVVFVHDVPVAEGPFGKDPRNPLLSSRPAEHLVAAGCQGALVRGDVVVLDANDNTELAAAARRCRDEDRTLVGTTGAAAAFAANLRSGPPEPGDLALPRPALIVCGSLHPLSRDQIAALELPVLALDAASDAVARLRRGCDAVLATPAAAGIDDRAARNMAERIAALAWQVLDASSAPTLVIVGGDTAEAVLGTRTLRVHGSVDTAVPLCETADGLRIVTKGGGIGDPRTLARLLRRPRRSQEGGTTA